MGHLYRFRKGWQSEHLAKYILSKFSFVAEPSTVSDDLGSDFFCTIFNIVKEDELLPQNSFAIQIKSKDNKFEITNKAQYLDNLEIPFFVGVINKELLNITIYSGEWLSNFFSLKGNPSDTNKIFIELTNERSFPLHILEENNYILKFPKILELDANLDYANNTKGLEVLFQICSLIQSNISARKSNEYIFNRLSSPPMIDIYAGPTSVKLFRNNYIKRLAEVFYNLKFLHNSSKKEDKIIIKKEFECYKQHYNNLKAVYNGGLPKYLTSCFKELDILINKK